jgi:small subunit ribosomal protein S1
MSGLVEPQEPADHGQAEPRSDGTPETPSVSPPPPPPPPSEITVPEPSAPGRIVEGVVTEVSTESVDLLLDDGRPAVINRRNFGLHNEEPSTVLSVGDRAFGAELAREDPKNRVVLSRVWALKRQAWDKLAKQAGEGEIIRCRVVSASKKGLVVDAGVRGFVPASHLELTAVTDFEPYLGEMIELKILEIDPLREKLVLSRRAILQKIQRKERHELMSSLKVGEIRKGRVQSLADYGAFVDIGGVSGLVHLSELSWYRVGQPADIVTIGDEVEVKILDIKVKKRRIGLSIRQTTVDPLEALEVGGILVGTVSRLVDFGAFVLVDGFEGLVHLSELAEYRVTTPESVVAPGDEVRVKVLSVDPSRRRIELSIRRAAEYQG